MTAHPFPGALGDDEGWMHVDSKHGGYSVFTKHIERSQQDDREYRLIRLDNGLQAMLVHDAKADKAAASIDVGVGHLHDPDDMPGLAHFCEHLLFMGTEQFPKENEYSEYLSRNSGHSNAFTSTMNTNYYFNVAPGALAGAIQRFAGFFHSPLFDPSCTLRELNAVDSEHKKNHQADLWRIYQVNKTLSRPGHPWNKFGTGNKESLTRVGRELKAKQAQAASSSTNLKKQALSASNSAAQSLAPSAVPSRAVSPAPSVSSVSSDVEADGGVVGRETRRRLVEWWSKEYCAGRMRLAVIGKDSLDDLTELVIENFSPILNRGQEPLPLILQNPFGENEKGTLVSVQTIMNFHCMEISWPLEWQPPLWQTKPGLHLSDLLGHEGPGSLHSFLKSQGWITELVAGPQALARGFQMFRVTVHMTADGFQHYRDIMLAVFNYISLIKSSTMELWHQHELAQISDIRFRFQEKRQPQDTAVSLSQQLAMPYPRELVIKAGTVNLPWDSANGEGLAAAQRLLESLKVEECRTVLMGRKDEHDKVAGEQEWQTEPIYGTQYRVQRYDQDFMREAVAPNTNKAFALPKPNDFIPQNLEVDKKEVPEPAKRPQLIKETPLYSLWHKKDDRYWVPKAHALIELRTPIVNDTPRHNVLAKLYTELVTDSLTEYAYAADLAGLAYNFINSSTGIYLFISGYNDKLHVLLKAILERAKTLQVKEDRLDVIRERLERDWKNFFLNQSYKISDYYGRYAMNKNQWTVDEKLAVLPTVTVADVQNFIADFSSSYKALILVSGNVYKEDALNYAKTVEDVLGGSPLSGPDPHDVVLLLPEGCNYVWEGPVPNKDEPNSALTYYVHFGEHIDPRTRVRDALLTQIMSEPAFNVLRTKEQLGYIVSAGQWIAPGQAYAGLRIIVQSERGPVYLENRVEAFLDHMKTLLEEIPDGEFQEQKEGLKNKWLEKPKNLNEEVSRYWNHIDNGFHDFLRRENDAALLDEISKEEILAHFMKHVHPSSSTRSKLSLHLRSQKPRAGHISRPAADAFEVAAREAGVPVDDVEWRELYADGEPTAAEFGKFWQTQPSLASVAPAVAAQLLGKMQELVVELPAEKDAEGVLPEGVTRIDDLETFRQTLKEASLPKKPLVEWNDLPAPHL